MNGRSICVLVVDDFERWRAVVCAALREKLGLHGIEEAVDGIDAVAKSGRPAARPVVLDIGFPRLNGIEVARRISRVSRKSTVVFLTENRSSDIAEPAFEEGASAYDNSLRP